MIDFKKYVKYAKPGPRYTSYPTAVEFSEKFTYDRYIQKLKSQNPKRPLSLYFHLPFCRSACYFCGCNVVFTSKEEKKDRYIKYLKKEMDILKRFLKTDREVIQLHFGGGTPTFFSAEQLKEIIDYIKKTFPNFSKDAEISCEIDPRFLTKEQMDILVEGGFNRVSFGVQDFNEMVQEAVHRKQSFEITKKAVDLAREAGIRSINIDLIYGLPYQTLDSFKETLELTLKLDPDRLAIFNYAHVPWLKKTMRKIDETTLPSPEEKLKILKYIIDFWTSHGYKMIGMDHFAKPEDELFKAIEKGELHRNFQGYTTKGGADLIGIGLTSIGEGEDYYAQNFKDMKYYENAIDEDKLPYWRGVELSEDDRIRKAVIMELMANFKLDIKKIEKDFHINFKEYFKDSLKELEEFEKEELLKITDNAIEVSQTGAMLIRNIAMAFDAYLKKHGEGKKVFSKTV
ncbi:oxygen-independent coproporphyrinogen III oxidase [Nitrosophilus kaiyonis]|uniref:oxygen-independent coproporphyrinogen III oxidase n=1 Tax=Nitrosophilus kaiyonis TaxID=2930200 RepID=UPI0024934350|nr:oxygen-independent coproporphyrinogen III oxidase [Nitrosophilus kaiyonis]